MVLKNWFLKIGMGLSILLVLIGGGIYLFDHGSQPYVIHHTLVENKPLIELKIIKYGLYMLILVQLIQLLFICGIFLIKRNLLSFFMSIFVVAFISFSIFSSFFSTQITL
jgi:hypothetical protein